MSDEECIHLLDPATCTICNGHDRKLKQEQDALGHTFEAKFFGKCGACRGLIEEGDWIFWAPGEAPVHNRCKGEQ